MGLVGDYLGLRPSIVLYEQVNLLDLGLVVPDLHLPVLGIIEVDRRPTAMRSPPCDRTLIDLDSMLFQMFNHVRHVRLINHQTEMIQDRGIIHGAFCRAGRYREQIDDRISIDADGRKWYFAFVKFLDAFPRQPKNIHVEVQDKVHVPDVQNNMVH